MTVPGVAAATVYLTTFTDRVLTGQVQVTDQQGRVSVATFGSVLPEPAVWGRAGGVALPLRNVETAVITDTLTVPVTVRQT